jgi:hypothetical protein
MTRPLVLQHGMPSEAWHPASWRVWPRHLADSTRHRVRRHPTGSSPAAIGGPAHIPAGPGVHQQASPRTRASGRRCTSAEPWHQMAERARELLPSPPRPRRPVNRQRAASRGRAGIPTPTRIAAPSGRAGPCGRVLPDSPSRRDKTSRRSRNTEPHSVADGNEAASRGVRPPPATTLPARNPVAASRVTRDVLSPAGYQQECHAGPTLGMRRRLKSSARGCWTRARS